MENGTNAEKNSKHLKFRGDENWNEWKINCSKLRLHSLCSKLKRHV